MSLRRTRAPALHSSTAMLHGRTRGLSAFAPGTIFGKAILLAAFLMTTMSAYVIGRGRDWLPPRMTIGLDAAALVAVAFVAWAMLSGLRRFVLRPIQCAQDHFERLGSGDYSALVPAERTDEFGNMLRALARMQAALAANAADCEAAERKHGEILKRSLYGFYQRTLDGQLLAANPALAAILGYESVESLLAEPSAALDKQWIDARQRDEFARLMEAQGFVSGYESALRRRDGRVIWVSEVARTVTEPDGRIYLEGFIDDITSRHEAEQIKADFVSFVTHQLRTPLAGIRWMLELAGQGSLDEETVSCIEDARLSAERLIALVNDLLDVTRLESGRLLPAAEATAIADITREVLGELTSTVAARQLRVTANGDGVPPVLMDPQLARKAVTNLLSNAMKYTPTGGSIHVGVTYDDEWVRWSVRDTGIGVPAAAQARLFEKFFRADNAQVVDTEGTGLGLYLVRLIAMRSGGSVACESTAGEGSTFTLTLPVAQERKAVA